MEKSIRAILDMDQQAFAMEKQAEKKRQAIVDTVAQRRQDLQTTYENGVAEAVAYTREEQKKRLLQEKAALDSRQAELVTAMAARVDAMHEEWVQALFRAVTEQE